MDGLSNTLAVGERPIDWANGDDVGRRPDSKLLDHQQPGKYAAGPAYVLGTTFNDGFNIEEGEMDRPRLDEHLRRVVRQRPSRRLPLRLLRRRRPVRLRHVDPAVMNALATRDGVAKGGQLVDPIIHDSPF